MSASVCPLKPRQLEAVKWLAEGKSAAEIGILMGKPHRTMEKIIFSAKDAAGVHKLTALVATALRQGWIQ